MKKSIAVSLLLLAVAAAGAFGQVVGQSSRVGGPAGAAGTFTLTDIPARYNGKYAALEGTGRGSPAASYVGCNINAGRQTPCRISNGRVSIPMWIVEDPAPSRFSGGDTLVLVVRIYDDENAATEKVDSRVLTEIAFSRGSASASWNAGLSE